MKPGPPGFVWDERMQGGRYRLLLPNGKQGNLISAASLAQNLRMIHEVEDEELRAIMDGYYEGHLTLSTVEYAIQAKLKTLHLSMAALARGGWSKVDSAVNARSADGLKREYAYLGAFLALVAANSLTRKEAVARAASYADNSFGRYWSETDLLRRENGAGEERLRTYPKACTQCVSLEAMGWVPLGTHKVPIHNGCRCEKEYR